MEIGDRIKELREKIGISQRAFADRIDLSGAFIAQLETGTREPKSIHITAICREFNVNENWLRIGKGEMENEVLADTVDQLSNELGLNELEKTLLTEYARLEEEDKKIFRKYFKNVMIAINESSATKESPSKKALMDDVAKYVPDEINSMKRNA